MFAALILQTFEIVFPGHLNQTSFPGERLLVRAAFQWVLVLCHFSRSGPDVPAGLCSFSTGPFQGSSVCFGDFQSVRSRGSSVGFSLVIPMHSSRQTNQLFPNSMPSTAAGSIVMPAGSGAKNPPPLRNTNPGCKF
jgi:hypothetical protein